MTKFICKDCKKEFDSFKKYQIHSTKVHKIDIGKLYVDTYLNGEWPLCKCGCGEKLIYYSSIKFGEYIRGHKARVSGGFYSEKGLQKSLETRKKRFASGEIVQWNKGKQYTTDQYNAILKGIQSEERREKISKALTGKPKSEAHREILKATLTRNRKEILKGNPSKLEFSFADILTGLGIEFVHQFHVEGFDYDFYIPEKNLLIEIDGDYWHGNPNKFSDLNSIQRKNQGLDKLKTKHAANNNYQLLRFWEQDIMERRFDCIVKLMEILK